MKDNDSKWTVIANGKSIANGTTIRRNGIVSHYTSKATDFKYKNSSPRAREKDSKSDKDDLLSNHEIETDAEDDTLKDDIYKTKRRALKVNTSGSRAPNGALSTVIQHLKWRESKGNFKSETTADLYWHGIGFEEGLYSKPGVYAVNKLPGMIELSQKIHLSRIMKRMQSLFPGEFDFYPPTWFLPEQYHQFVAEVSMRNKSKPNIMMSNEDQDKKGSLTDRLLSENRTNKETVASYIVKPDCGSQGEGIYLVNDPRDVQDANESKPAIVQKYIDDPLLLDNFKFDLRMYVTVARLNPVEIYLCKDGLARLCTVAYEQPKPANICNSFMHLTNYSLNKFSDDFIQTNSTMTGSKRTYRSVMQILKKQGHDIDKIHKQIVDLVVKTVLSLIPDITIWDHVTNRSKLVRSFQILGFDILLTSDLRAHLLEVNSSPSMGIDVDRETEPGSGIYETVTSLVDEQIKVNLLRDVLRLIAYGESEIDMKKSCLERLYPPYRTAASRDTASSRFQHLTKTQLSSHSTIKMPNFTSSSKRSKDMPHEISKAPPTNTEDTHCQLTSKEKTNVNLSNEIGIEGVNSGKGFDNPLLRNRSISPRHNSAKRLKRFTVIKYRQEYAISTEEWRLLQLRNKLSNTLNPTLNFQNNREATKSIQQKYLTPTKTIFPKVENVKCKEETNVFCKVCGHYLDGAGPGLYFSQQKHKAIQEEQAENKSSRKLLLSPSRVSNLNQQFLEDASDHKPYQRQYSEWETERRTPRLNHLPPRSFHFTCAQDDPAEVSIPFGRGWDPPSLPPSPLELTESSRLSHRKNICENCIDQSSDSSTPDNGISKTRFKPVSVAEKWPNSKRNEKHNNQKKENKTSFAMKEVMLIKRIAAIFIYFNGIKPSLKINATAFRNMARRCRLCEQGSMPAIDILFIDTMRQWQRHAADHNTPYYDTYRCKNPITSHQQVGIPFQGFIEALFRIAKTRFKGVSLKEKMEALVINCERYMKEATRADNIARRRREMKPKPKVAMSPRISCGLSQRQPYY